MHLPHWSNLSPCWECDCTKSSDVPSKCYKTLEVDSQSFVYVDSKAAKVNPRSDHPMFTLPGVTTRMVRGDGLHILFTKGVYARLLGSILHYMCWYDRVGRPQAKPPCERLAYIFSEVQQQYKRQESRCRLTNLRLNMFTQPKRPHLHGLLWTPKALSASTWPLPTCLFAKLALTKANLKTSK